VLHERRIPCARVVPASGLGQKFLDVVSYNPVKRSSLGVAATVLGRKWTARGTRRALEGQWRAQSRRIAHDFGGYGWGGIHPPEYRLPAADVSSDLSNCPVEPLPWLTKAGSSRRLSRNPGFSQYIFWRLAVLTSTTPERTISCIAFCTVRAKYAVCRATSDGCTS